MSAGTVESEQPYAGGEPLALGMLLRVLLRYWILILVLTVLGAVAAFGATRFMTPVYTATATQLVKGLPGNDVAANYEASQYAVARAKSYPSFIDSGAVLDGVRGDLGNRLTTTELRDVLSAENPTDTPLLLISATGNTPQDARDAANSAARHMARFITEIETVAGKSPVGVETAVEASLPTKPTSPQVPLLTALGAVVGFALGVGIALILAARSGRRRHERAPRTPQWDDPSDEPTDEPSGGGVEGPAEAQSTGTVDETRPGSAAGDAGPTDDGPVDPGRRSESPEDQLVAGRADGARART